MSETDSSETDRRIVAELAKARIDNDARHISKGADPEDYGYLDYTFEEAKQAVERALEETEEER